MNSVPAQRSSPQVARRSNRDVLRMAIRESHDRAEAVWTGAGGIRVPSVYRDWLICLRSVHARIGLPAARTIGGPAEVEDELARINALSADIGAPLPAEPTETGAGGAWAWGARYALNGSMLGASQILKSGDMAHYSNRAYLTCARAYAKSGKLAAFFQALNARALDLDAARLGAEQVFAAISRGAKAARSD